MTTRARLALALLALAACGQPADRPSPPPVNPPPPIQPPPVTPPPVVPPTPARDTTVVLHERWEQITSYPSCENEKQWGPGEYSWCPQRDPDSLLGERTITRGGDTTIVWTNRRTGAVRREHHP